jgi:hypothetical protein
MGPGYNSGGEVDDLSGHSKDSRGFLTALMKGGGLVPGIPTVDGDSPRNDKVHAILSPGEIVIPRSIADNPKKAMAFIDAINKHKESDVESYGDVVASKKGVAGDELELSHGGSVCKNCGGVVQSYEDGGYAENLPCRNSACKSYGEPHPNCMCY